MIQTNVSGSSFPFKCAGWILELSTIHLADQGAYSVGNGSAEHSPIATDQNTLVAIIDF